MSLRYEDILDRLRSLEDGASAPARYLVAFSGGVDSTVLLHALAATRDDHKLPVVAIHVDHDLHDDSAAWSKHCEQVARSLGVSFIGRKVEVAEESGFGIEAAAREARYGVMHGIVRRNDWLLSAHHEDDQAETLLLNLFRGSSLAGLAGIGRNRAFGQGRLVRPMLGVGVNDILQCARHYNLHWIDDPSNDDRRFDRNFLRKTILPELAQRWPAVSTRIRQSADLAGEASDLLDSLAKIDMTALGDGQRLDISAMQELSSARQRNVLRFAIRQCGLPPAPATRLYRTLHELMPARPDAQPLVEWPGGEIRRNNGYLYILAPAPGSAEPLTEALQPGGDALDLGAGQGRLRLVAGSGISAEVADAGLSVRYRQGGEEIRTAGNRSTRKLKKLLQESLVVPWMRSRIPLLYAGETLVAVGDLWVAADTASDSGYQVVWEDRPALY